MTPEHLPTEQYDAQLAEKVVRLQSMMTPFAAPVPEVFRSPVSHYRMRAEFRIWHDGDDLLLLRRCGRSRGQLHRRIYHPRWASVYPA
jgi:tRNA/tmRNA/rRNA uracil-C5-methylase (TrmA/RlmC/RlmD family)